ncbi:hypothetical protein BN1263310052 [Stenotrophomonas indicatrix]|nr:hypothetical protein BN1263310052 [Stenotrophomonas indicatrix]
MPAAGRQDAKWRRLNYGSVAATNVGGIGTQWTCSRIILCPFDSEQIHPQCSVIRPPATALGHRRMQMTSVIHRRSSGG